jgi:hypothetical protein
MNTGLRLTFGQVTIQNWDKLANDYLGFSEFGLENSSDFSSELVFHLPYTNQMRYEVRSRDLVGSPILITALGSLARRSTRREITRVELFGATCVIVCGRRVAVDSLNLEVL